jgi:hydroxymethylpyrimidine pyrophosphatase-like HAD family hydrolase
MAVIAIDFDNTLVNIDKPLDGAKDAINSLREMGHKIIIHSCNNPNWIERVLADNDIKYDYVWNDKGKPICDLYIDDKSFRFVSWDDQIGEIVSLLEGFDNRKW